MSHETSELFFVNYQMGRMR